MARRMRHLLVASFAVALLLPFGFDLVLWLPDDQGLMILLVALLVGAGVFFFAASGRRERSYKKSLRLSVTWAAMVLTFVLVHLVLDAVLVVKLDTNAAGGGLAITDASFPSGKVLRIGATSPLILDFIKGERRTNKDYSETTMILVNPSEYWDIVKREEPMRTLCLSLAFLATYLGAVLSASAFLGCLVGLLSGAGMKEYELKSFPLPDIEEGLDVFISYGHCDQEVVLKIAEELRATGLGVWLDVWNSPPGGSWPERIEAAIDSAHSVIVCRGAEDIGYWQRQEIKAFHSRAHDGLIMIPLILPGGPGPDKLGALLRTQSVVDMSHGFTQQKLSDLSSAVGRSAG